MDNWGFIFILIVLLCIWHIRKKRRTAAAVHQVLARKKQNREILIMKELAKQFIGKECIIYTIASNDGSIQGTIKTVEDGGMIIEKASGEQEIINIDFVTRIREYPRNKNGRKKIFSV